MKLTIKRGLIVACYRQGEKKKLYRSLDDVWEKQTFEGECEGARILFHLLMTGFTSSNLRRMHGQGQLHLWT